jgi:hypothetical protein
MYAAGMVSNEITCITNFVQKSVNWFKSLNRVHILRRMCAHMSAHAYTQHCDFMSLLFP